MQGEMIVCPLNYKIVLIFKYISLIENRNYVFLLIFWIIVTFQYHLTESV